MTPKPLDDNALDQVRAMLGDPAVDATYDRNVQLLLGTSRALLATLDQDREARKFSTDSDTLLEFIAWCVDNPLTTGDIFDDPREAKAAVKAFLHGG